MATISVTRDPLWQFIGEDVRYPFAMGFEDGTAIDVTSWAWSFKVKKNLAHEDIDAVLGKASGAAISVSGAFDPDSDLNQQRVIVTAGRHGHRPAAAEAVLLRVEAHRCQQRNGLGARRV